MPTPPKTPILLNAESSPLSSIRTDFAFAGDRVNVFFAPAGFRAPADGSIAPGSNTVPVAEGFNAYEKEQFRAVFETIEHYIDLSFDIVSARRDADFTLLLDTNQFTGNTLGYFYLPNGAEQYGIFNGAKWDRSPGGDLEIGGLGFVTMMHETLHGLGLDHPHDDQISEMMEGVEKRFDDYGTANLNQGLYTTMGYNDGYHAGPVGTAPPSGALYGNQAGPMALDIAVLQQIYGANTNTNAGDDIYALDGSNGTGTHWRSIWDVGGTDTIAYKGGRDAVIDLRAATLQYEDGGGGFVSAAKNVAGGYTVASGVVIENATGGAGDDRLTGNGADNVLTGGAGDDTLWGGGGSDRAVFADASTDLSVSAIDGGYRVASASEGTDEMFAVATLVARDGTFLLANLSGETVVSEGEDMFGTFLADRIFGTAMSERVQGFGGNDTIEGGAGQDAIEGGVGFDLLSGGDDGDRLLGGNGFDTLNGDEGDDRLEGGFGNDVLSGGEGDDVLNGGLGFDRMAGGAGDDTLDALDGYDTLIGGDGRDVLNGNAGDDSLSGNAGIDDLRGGIGADVLIGGGDADSLLGGNGADRLDGGAGDDILYGNAGADRLVGGDGDDRLFGGIGADEFVFEAGGGRDTVMDLGIVDRLTLDADLVGDAPLGRFASETDGDLALDFGAGDVLVFFGVDRLAQIADQIDIA